MSGVQLTLIQSRVGRRVATLFVLCALVPMLVLSGVVSWLVSAHLLSREEDRLRALAKESAMASVERLLDVEERLRVVAGQPAAIVAPDSLRGVTALVRLDPQGRPVPLFGRTSTTALDNAARDRLGAGRAVMRLPARRDDPIHIVVPTTGPARYDGSALVAALDMRTVWGLDERTGDGRVTREACGAVPAMQVLDCTDGVVDRQALAAALGSPGPDTFVARMDGEEWMGARWSAPLQAGFGVAEWTGVVVTRTADTLAPARALARTVGLLVVATFCLVLLVSFQQIRRLLDPITKLHQETARLAQGDFAARVDVRTGDELQGLCDAFNAMAGDLQRQFAQLHALSVGTLEALARAIDAKSPWTAGHSTRVTEIALAIGRAMRLGAPVLERINRGALLHDIGKIGISADILDKAGPLTAAEMAIVREHPATGARILEPLPHCADILPMVLQHHERLDGSGYPSGLAGAQIAFEARILAVADVYDAMTSDRPYRRGMPPRDVAVHIAAGAGTHFDPLVVEAFGDAFRTGRIPPAAAAATSSRIA